MIIIKNVNSSLLKQDEKHTRTLVFTTSDTLQEKKLMIVKMLLV